MKRDRDILQGERTMEMTYLGSTQDDSADVGVLCRPRESQLRSVTTKLLRNRRQLPDLFDLGLTLGGLQLLDRVLEEALVGRESAVLGDTVVVLAGQETRCQGRPDGCAVLELLKEGCVFDFEAFTVEGVVLGLLDHRGDQVITLCDLSGFHDLGCAPFRRSPVVGEVHVDALGKGFDNLLHGGGIVWSVSENLADQIKESRRSEFSIPVSEDNVDVRLLKALERALQAFHDVLLRKTSSVRLLTTGTKEDL